MRKRTFFFVSVWHRALYMKTCECFIVASEISFPQKHCCKGKGHPITSHQGPRGGVEVSLYSFSTSAVGEGGCSAPRPGRFTPGKDPVPIVQEAGWAPGPVWTCANNLAPTGIRSPDRPACSQSLYLLSYAAHKALLCNSK
jgi:hypothetical protein